MGSPKFIDQWSATLQFDITTGSTVIYVETALADELDTHRYWSYFLTIDDGAGNFEVVFVTSKGGGGALTVERGRAGTTAQVFAAGATVECRIPSEVLHKDIISQPRSLNRRQASVDSGTIWPDEDGQVTWIDLDANETITMNNGLYDTADESIIWHHTVFVKQDATGGHSLYFDTGIVWANGVAPTMSSAAHACDVFEFWRVNWNTRWLGIVKAQNIPLPS